MTSPIRILCVDDNEELAAALGARIERTEDMVAVGRLTCADNLITRAQETQPDVVLMDLAMPGRPPLEAVAELTAALPEVRVLVFTGSAERGTVDRAIEAGAWGLVEKGEEPERLLQAIRLVRNDEMVFPGEG